MSVKLKGVLDFSLGNFLCLRGYAPLGVLFDISEPAPSIQRDLLNEHRDEMVAFLILQRDFILLRDFDTYYETLPLGRFVVRFCKRERVRFAWEQ